MMKNPARSVGPAAGNVMLVTLSAIATLATCLAVTLTITQTIARNVQRTSKLQLAVGIGDSALELAYANWREICKQNYSINLPTSSFASIDLPNTSDFPGLSPFTVSRTAATSTQNITIANYRIQAVDPQISTANGDSTLSTSTAPPNSTGQNPNETSVFYLATADVTVPALGTGSRVQAKMRRVLEKQRTSPFNCAIFYTDTLEIHPGPAFVVTGAVHTNGKLYTGHNTLTLTDKTTYVDDWSIGFSPNETSHSAETPTAPNYPADLPPARGVAEQPIGMDASRLFNTGNTNPNDDSYREFIERPDPNFPDPVDDIRYYSQAGVRILVDANNAITIKRKNGAGEVAINSASTGADAALYAGVMAAISTNVTIQDNREEMPVRLVTLDIAALNAGNYSNTAFNNIVYISDTSATASNRRGVRLKNGRVLPTAGLTVASDNPVYIQGDFNTGGTSANQPRSNTNSDPTQPTVSGYTRKPAAIAGDAVMILSNNWNDANNTLANRNATNTTVNAAILSGIVASSGGHYSGGAENFPRFMENWGSARITYYGSMVELFQSQQAIGLWGKANVYAAPDRRWYFDTNFYANPPPGSLVLTLYIKQRWYLE